jgi:hypothetical protein
MGTSETICFDVDVPFQANLIVACVAVVAFAVAGLTVLLQETQTLNENLGKHELFRLRF